MDAANGRRETERDRWYAMVTQVDWSGEIMKESWYGHRNPCHRLALWVHFSALLGCCTLTIHALSSWPILRPFLTVSELKDMQASHEACFESLCRALESISFTCEMMHDSQITIVDDPFPAGRIEFPQECHIAIEKTFGKESESALLASGRNPYDNDDDEVKRELDLLHFGTVSKEIKNIPIFQIRPEDCLVQERLLEHLLVANTPGGPSSMSFMIDIVDSFAMNPGDRQTVHLRSYICPHSMSQFMLREILPQSKQVYSTFMTWRRTTGVALIYFFHMAFYSAKSATNLFYLFIPATILWYFLPKNEIRGQRITFFNTLGTLLLLTTLTDEGTASYADTIRTGILVTSAFSFHNSNAAVEWCFLFFLSCMEIHKINVPNGWLLALDPSQRITPLVDAIIDVIIPGEGLWKWVWLYILYMSFPRMNRRQEGTRIPEGEDHLKQD